MNGVQQLMRPPRQGHIKGKAMATRKILHAGRKATNMLLNLLTLAKTSPSSHGLCRRVLSCYVRQFSVLGLYCTNMLILPARSSVPLNVLMLSWVQLGVTLRVENPGMGIPEFSSTHQQYPVAAWHWAVRYSAPPRWQTGMKMWPSGSALSSWRARDLASAHLLRPPPPLPVVLAAAVIINKHR